MTSRLSAPPASTPAKKKPAGTAPVEKYTGGIPDEKFRIPGKISLHSLFLGEKLLSRAKFQKRFPICSERGMTSFFKTTNQIISR